MKRSDTKNIQTYECEVCRRKTPFVLAYGGRYLCTQCFAAEADRAEEIYGHYQEEYETFINE